MEGGIRLPPGATVIELPRESRTEGPDGARASSVVESVVKDGTVYVRARTEYDVPLVVGSDRYDAWRVYQSFLAGLGQQRCIIAMTGPELSE